MSQAQAQSSSDISSAEISELSNRVPDGKGNIVSPVFGRRRFRKSSKEFLRKIDENVIKAVEELIDEDNPDMVYLEDVQQYEDHFGMTDNEFINTLRQECVQEDECHGQAFWNEIGMQSQTFLNELPISKRTHVVHLDLGYPLY